MEVLRLAMSLVLKMKVAIGSGVEVMVLCVWPRKQWEPVKKS